MDARKQRLRMEWAKRDHVVILAVSGVTLVMCVLYTFSRNIPTHYNQVDSNLANLEGIVEVG